jgi:predicted nucleic acid-binding protein
MATFFLDSNVIIKYYFTEPGSSWVRRFINDSEHACLISEISIPEVAAALSQLQRHKRVGKAFVGATYERFHDDMRQGLFLRYHLNSSMLEHAATLALVHLLKGYDAVQVASAVSAQHSLALNITFVSGDKQALVAAGGVGLLIDDPFDHVVPEDLHK